MSRTYTYPTIKTVTATTRAKGESSTATLQTMFPNSPGLVSGDLPTADSVAYKEAALALLLDGVVDENLQVGSYNRDYSENGAPDYADGAVPAEGPGPASAWVPNPTSPGEGSVDPNDQGAAPEGFGVTPTNSIANIGKSTDVTAPGRNPSTSSSKMSTRVTISELGKSPATQNAE